MLPLGDVEVEYNANFRLFLTTELSNPHFQADTAIRVNLINFTVTRRGLEDQLLCEVRTDIGNHRKSYCEVAVFGTELAFVFSKPFGTSRWFPWSNRS